MRTRAKIVEVRQETPSVKSFLFALADNSFSFLPGQWLDLYAPIHGNVMVGGYSITSSPAQKGYIELAVKGGGRNPVARYLHEGARVGDAVEVDGGHGDFFFERGMAKSLTLVGGGIGINPLMSILRYCDDFAPEVPVAVVMSAKAPSELLFRKAIEAISVRRPLTRAFFAITGPGDEPWAGHVGRVDAAWLHEIGVDLNSLFYLCGPPGMPDNLARQVMGLGVPRSQVRFEQWW